MFLQKITKLTISLIILVFSLNSCGGKIGADARKYPPNPEERVKKNIEDGRGFRLTDSMKKRSGNFEFASSNPLWRASLDTIDFMPLASVNYSGGIIITDWYAANTTNESIKISIRFLTNEIRSDALAIKVFNKKCDTSMNCKTSETTGNLILELKTKILKTAAIYEKQIKSKNLKPYQGFKNKRVKKRN